MNGLNTGLNTFIDDSTGNFLGRIDNLKGYTLPVQDNYYPYVPTYPNYIFTTLTTIEPSYLIKVEKCENGFIVHKNGQKFVCKEPEDIAQYLKD